MKSRHSRRAISLIELMMVIAVLAILSAYAIPGYMDWSTDARKAKAKHDLSTLAELVSKYEIDVNAAQAKTIVRLRNLSELKGRYISNLDALRDPFGYEYKVLAEVGEVIYLELLPDSSDRYKKFVEDSPSKHTGEHPKIIYSVGPNGKDEKGKGDDIKHECRKFRYFHSIVTKQ